MRNNAVFSETERHFGGYAYFPDANGNVFIPLFMSLAYGGFICALFFCRHFLLRLHCHGIRQKFRQLPGTEPDAHRFRAGASAFSGPGSQSRKTVGTLADPAGAEPDLSGVLSF